MQLRDFIDKAKQQNIDIETIRGSLRRQGWSDASIDQALLGDIEVPRPPAPERTDANVDARPPQLTPERERVHAPTNSTGPLFSALHHVLLWFFIGSTSFAITSAISSLFHDYVSEDALASFIAVSVVTFIPYSVVFLLYLRKRRLQPQLIPGRVWSIITICIASIGVMAATITAVVALINSTDSSVAISAGALIILYASVIVTYATAAFMVNTKERTRRWLLRLPIIIVTALLLGVFIPSLLQLGPIKNDNQLREDLVTTVNTIRQIAQAQQSLPESADSYLANPEITYRKLTGERYQLCAPFSVKSNDRSYPSMDVIQDNYVSTYDFNNSGISNCFTIETDLPDNKFNSDNGVEFRSL